MAFPQDNSSSAESRSFLAAGQYQESDSGRPDSATPRASFHALFDQRSVSDASILGDGASTGSDLSRRTPSPAYSFDGYGPSGQDASQFIEVHVPGDASRSHSPSSDYRMGSSSLDPSDAAASVRNGHPNNPTPSVGRSIFGSPCPSVDGSRAHSYPPSVASFAERRDDGGSILPRSLTAVTASRIHSRSPSTPHASGLRRYFSDSSERRRQGGSVYNDAPGSNDLKFRAMSPSREYEGTSTTFRHSPDGTFAHGGRFQSFPEAEGRAMEGSQHYGGVALLRDESYASAAVQRDDDGNALDLALEGPTVGVQHQALTMGSLNPARLQDTIVLPLSTTSSRFLLNILRLEPCLILAKDPLYSDPSDVIVPPKHLRALFARALLWFIDRECLVDVNGVRVLFVGLENGELPPSNYPSLALDELRMIAEELPESLKTSRAMQDFDTYMFHAGPYSGGADRRLAILVISAAVVVCAVVAYVLRSSILDLMTIIM
ncbi:hypothetical protein OH77DRAFT_835103 [Trametes cingulata]|nr:hypothetical protein OH77DRAFT_835103 [Trametes cingulata]